MASCPRCGGSKKLNKRTDGWYHCQRHGPVRKVNTPFYLIKKEETKMKYLTPEKIARMDDDFSFVPHHIRDTLINYIESGLPTGSFVNAVLSNDLAGAFGQADHINQQHIGSIVAWLWNFASSTCWGSSDKVKAWYAGFNKHQPPMQGRGCEEPASLYQGDRV